MKTKLILLPVAIIIALNLITFMGNAQNVGIGTASPAQKLEIGATTGTIRIDGMITGNSFNTSATSSSNLVFVNNSTGDLSALANGGHGQVLALNGSGVPSWTTLSVAYTNAWGITGNNNTNSSTNFIGTVSGTTNPQLVFKVNGVFSGELDNVNSNTSFGYEALLSNAGISNVAIGYDALPSNAGSGNIAIGYEAFPSSAGSENIVIGYQAGGSYSGSNNIAIGQSALTSAGAGSNNIAIGNTANINAGSDNTVIGAGTNTSSGLSNATAIGYQASVSTSNTVVLGNTSVGSLEFNGALMPNESGTYTAGNSGQPLLSNGAGTEPSWSAITLSNTNSVTGTLPVANGGTGATTLASHGVIYGNGTSAVGITAAGTSGQVLTANGSGIPVWAAVTATSVGGWALTGNGSTTPGTDYVGTSDAKDLVFATDGSENMRLSNSTGNLVIGSGDGGGSGNIIRAPYASGGNKDGVDFTIAAGAPTGKSGSGNIIFQELAANVGSPGNTSDLSIMAEAMRITNTGALSFGSTGTATGNANNVLLSGSSTINPSWGQLPLNDNTNAVTGTLAATNGGTGQSAYTIGDILYASSTSALTKLSDIATGNVLISGGTSTAPSWSKVGLTTAVSGILPIANGGTNSTTALSGSSIMVSNGSSIVQGTAGTTTTLLHGNASGIPTYSAASLTTDVTGTLPVGNGGTGQTSYTVGDILYASSTSALTKLSDIATGNVLISGGTSTAPSWSKVGLTTAVSGILPIANGGTNSTTALSGSSIMVSNGSSIIQGVAGTTTTVLHGNASGTPSYSAIGLTTDVTGILPVTNGGTNSSTALSGSSIMVSNGSSIVQGTAGTTTTLLHGNASGIPTYSAASLTTDVTGTLPVANGGTNSSTALSGSSIMVSNGASVIQGAAGTTTTVLHGNAAGAPSYSGVSLTNDITGTLGIANGGTALTTTPANGQLLIGNGTNYTLAALATGTGISVTNAAGSITLANTGVTSLGVTATIHNTGTSTTPMLDIEGSAADIGSVLYSTGAGSSAAFVATGLSGQVLTSNGTSAPTWGAVSGSVITANNGLNFSTATNLQLGGTLTANTTITQNNFNYVNDFGTGTGTFAIQKGSSPYLFVNNAGSIGIGTVSPAGILDVEGGTEAIANTAANDIDLVAQSATGTGTTSTGGTVLLQPGTSTHGAVGTINLNGHLQTQGALAATPVSVTGSSYVVGTILAGSNDQAGAVEFTGKNGAGTVTVNFGTAYATPPVVIITWATGNIGGNTAVAPQLGATYSVTSNTTSFTVSIPASALSGTAAKYAFNYIVIQVN